MFCTRDCRVATLITLFIMLIATTAIAGGTVTYTDGSPASGAKIIVTGGGVGKTVVTCDADGRFELSNISESSRIQVKAAEKHYEPLRLPASLFKSGDVAIVLQPKSTKKNK